MIGGGESASNDILGGADMFADNDLIGGTEPVASEPVANDLLGGVDMFGGNDLIGGTEPAMSEPVPNDILGGNDLIGGSEPTADNLIGGGTDMFATNDLIGGMETVAETPAAAEPAPAADGASNGIIDDPLMDLGGMFETPGVTPAPTAQPQAPAMDANPFSFIDPEL